VIFTGFRQDIAGLLGFVEFVIQPSLYEGLSMLILEAMSAGKAVVATDVGGNSQLINDGENGLLVEAKYPEALAQAMIQLLSDREAAVSFGEEGRRVAREKFDLKLMVRRYENLYTLLARPGEDA